MSAKLLFLAFAVLGTASSLQTPAPRVDQYGDPLPPGVLARCGSSRLRHGETPDVMLFTPDKKLLITSSSGRYRGGVARLLVWEVATGKLVRKLTMKRGDVMAAILSTDGRQLACACSEGEQIEFCRFELATGQMLRKQLLRLPHRILALKSDGTLWAAGADTLQCEVIQLDLETSQPRSRFSFKLTNLHPGVAFSGDGQWLGVSSSDHSLRVYSLATGRLHKTLQQAKEKKDSPDVDDPRCVFSSDGRWLVRTFRIWGQHVQELELWEISTGKRHLHSNRTAIDSFHVAFTSDNQHLLFHLASKCQMHHLATGKTVQSFSLTDNHREVAFSLDGQLLAASTYYGILSFWDMSSGKKLPNTAEAELYFPWLDGITIRQGKICVDGPDRLAWDPSTGKRQLPWVRWDEEPNWVDPPKGTLDVRRLKDGRRRLFSSDGQWVAFQDRTDYHICLWNLKTGREMVRVKYGSMDSMDLSSNGRWLAVSLEEPPKESEDAEVFLWDVPSGTVVHKLKHHEKKVRCLAFSPDARMLATCSLDTTLRLWETATGQQRHVFTGHETEVQALGFTPDGRLLAAHSEDAPVFVWEVHGHQVKPLTAAEMEQAWLDMHSSDASLAFKAIQRLAATPKLAVPLLHARLQPIPAATPERTRQLIALLASRQFTEREKAASELQQVADQVMPQLRQALQGQLSAEVRRRLEEIVRQAETAAPDLLRALRAVEALEWIGTPEVLPILDRLAGAPEATLTKEAKASAQRLREKKAKP